MSVDSSTVCCCSLENTAAVSETARDGRTRPASTEEWDIGGDYRDTGVRWVMIGAVSSSSVPKTFYYSLHITLHLHSSIIGDPDLFQVGNFGFTCKLVFPVQSHLKLKACTVIALLPPFLSGEDRLWCLLLVTARLAAAAAPLCISRVSSATHPPATLLLSML